MLFRQLRKLSTQSAQDILVRINANKSYKKQVLESIKNEKCEQCDIHKRGLETYAFIFAVGGCVELYTYSNTKDITRSTGLGWALLAILII